MGSIVNGTVNKSNHIIKRQIMKKYIIFFSCFGFIINKENTAPDTPVVTVKSPPIL